MINQIIEMCLAWMCRPIHGMAALLHPLYQNEDTASNPELLAMHDLYLEATHPQTKIKSSMVSYMHSLGATFSRPTCNKEEETKTPLNWWLIYGYKSFELQQVALRVLSQVSHE